MPRLDYLLEYENNEHKNIFHPKQTEIIIHGVIIHVILLLITKKKSTPHDHCPAAKRRLFFPENYKTASSNIDAMNIENTFTQMFH